MSSSVASIAEWQKRVAALVPSLSSSQAKVLGLLSYGIVLFDGCGMTRLSKGLGKVEQVPAERLRQRLREFYYETQAKRGKNGERCMCKPVLETCWPGSCGTGMGKRPWRWL